MGVLTLQITGPPMLFTERVQERRKRRFKHLALAFGASRNTAERDQGAASTARTLVELLASL
jgi:hypothetical protein